VHWLTRFRGISTLTALGLLAEIGDFRRFASARELMSFLGLTVSEYSSGGRRQRGSTTKTGNRHARRLLVEAAWHYQHPPRLSARIRATQPLVPSQALARAWQAQIRLHDRHRHLSKRQALDRRHRRRRPRALRLPLGDDDATAAARRPLRSHSRSQAGARSVRQRLGDARLGPAAGADPVRNLGPIAVIPG
jgi:hypothetical protein